MGFYRQQSVIHTYTHARTNALTHARTHATLLYLYLPTYLLAIQSKQISSSHPGVVVSIMDCCTEGHGFESCWSPFLSENI